MTAAKVVLGIVSTGFFAAAIWHLALGNHEIALACWVGVIANNAHYKLEDKADAT
jgi:hypothetical protein